MRIRAKLLCGLLCCILMLTMLTGCAKEKIPQVAWNPPPTTEPKPLPEVYAASIAHHGCYWYGYPQNTLECIRACLRDGWKMVDFDIWWTADDVPVLSHKDLRTVYGTDETIRISTSTYEELMAVQLHDDESIHIATFYEIIDVCKEYGVTACIEFKARPNTKQLDALIDYLRNADMIRNCAWLCFNLDPLLAVVKRDPQATVMLCLSEAPELSWLSTEPRIAKLLDREGETVLSYNYKCLSSMEDADAYLSSIKNAGCSIGLWTIDNPRTICRYAEIADYITSNLYTVEEAWAK